MHPVLFRVGTFPIGTYALFVLIALVAGCATFSALAARDGRSRVAFLEIGLWAFIVALVTSKLFGAVLELDPQRPAESLKHVLRYGGHYYVGVLAGVTFLVLAFRRMAVPFATGLDYLAPALALAHGIGRIGCLLAGCCWGAACDLPWAITFTSEDAPRGLPRGVPLHPTQLYEFAAETLIAAFLLWRHLRHRGRPGTTFLWYVVLYGIVRFLVEFVRDDPRGTLFDMPTSQPLAVLSAVVAGAILWTRRGHSSEGGAPSSPKRRARRA